MIEKRLGAVLGAIALAAGSACAATQQMGGPGALAQRNVGTVISVLPAVDNTCTVVVKQPTIKAYAGRRLTFTVLNFCPEEINANEVVVRVGNFRRAGTTGAPSNCDNPMYPSNEPRIFVRDDLENDRTARVPPADEDKPKQKRIGLNVKPGNELPDLNQKQIEYDFDVCLGDTKVDPRLVIER